jgi:hypothetical protein
LSFATRLDTQTADDVNFTGGRIFGVTISNITPEFTQIFIGEYRLFVDAAGSLVVQAPDGSTTTLVLKT